MEQKFSIELDVDFNICGRCQGDIILGGYTEVTEEEFKESYNYKKFNPETREFSEPIEKEQEVNKPTIESLQKEVNKLQEENEMLNTRICELQENLAELLLEGVGNNGINEL